MDGIEFAGRTASGKLRMSAGNSGIVLSRAEFVRQSVMLIPLTALRALPVSTPLAALVWRLTARFIPAQAAFFHSGWFAGVLSLLFSALTGLLVWLTWRWRLSGDRLHIRRGIICRRELSVHRNAVQSVETVRTPLCRLFGTAYLYIRTSDREHDRLLLPRSTAVMSAARLMPSSSGRTHNYRAESLGLWLAAMGSGGLTFVSAATPALSFMQDIAGAAFRERFNVLVQHRGIFFAGALFVLLLWSLKVIYARLNTLRMGYTASDARLLLGTNGISQRSHCISVGAICAIDTRTTLFGTVCDRHSSSILLPVNHLHSLLPPVSGRRLRIELASVSSHGRRICTVQPVSSGIRYAAGRWLMCLSALPVFSLVRRLLPSMSTTIPVIGFTAAFLLVLRALISTAHSHRSGLALFSDCCELTGTKGMSAHTLRVFRGSTALIRIRQNPLARTLGYCTLRIYPYGSKRGALSSIKLPFRRTLAVCERLM